MDNSYSDTLPKTYHSQRVSIQHLNHGSHIHLQRVPQQNLGHHDYKVLSLSTENLKLSKHGIIIAHQHFRSPGKQLPDSIQRTSSQLRGGIQTKRRSYEAWQQCLKERLGIKRIMKENEVMTIKPNVVQNINLKQILRQTEKIDKQMDRFGSVKHNLIFNKRDDSRLSNYNKSPEYSIAKAGAKYPSFLPSSIELKDRKLRVKNEKLENYHSTQKHHKSDYIPLLKELPEDLDEPDKIMNHIIKDKYQVDGIRSALQNYREKNPKLIKIIEEKLKTVQNSRENSNEKSPRIQKKQAQKIEYNRQKHIEKESLKRQQILSKIYLRDKKRSDQIEHVGAQKVQNNWWETFITNAYLENIYQKYQTKKVYRDALKKKHQKVAYGCLIIGKIMLRLKKARIRIVSKLLRPHFRIYIAKKRHQKKMAAKLIYPQIMGKGGQLVIKMTKCIKIQRYYRKYIKLKKFVILQNIQRWRNLEKKIIEEISEKKVLTQVEKYIKSIKTKEIVPKDVCYHYIQQYIHALKQVKIYNIRGQIAKQKQINNDIEYDLTKEDPLENYIVNDEQNNQKVLQLDIPTSQKLKIKTELFHNFQDKLFLSEKFHFLVMVPLKHLKLLIEESIEFRIAWPQINSFNSQVIQRIVKQYEENRNKNLIQQFTENIDSFKKMNVKKRR